VERALLNRIALAQERMVRDLRDFVRIPSVSKDRDQVKAALAFYLDRARQMGLKARSVLSDRVGVVEWGAGEETVGVLVHADVVGPGERSEWPCDPFEGMIAEDRVFGRGTVDDKGPAISVLYALDAIRAVCPDPRKRVQIIIGTQEETEWSDIAAYAAAYKLPDYGFTPDGEFPIANREKGYVDVEVSFPSAEIGGIEEYRLQELSGGHGANSIPDRARATVRGPGQALSRLKKRCEAISFMESEALVDGLRLTAKGRSAHSSLPHAGVNAIERLCEVLATEPFAPSALAEAVRFLDAHREDPYGRRWGLYRLEDLVEGQYFDHTTIVPTRIETKEGGVAITYNLRTVPPVDRRQIEAAFRERLLGFYGVTRILDYKDPLMVSPRYPFLEVMARAYEEVSGLPNSYRLAYGTSYAKAMDRFVSWGPLFPGDEDTAHQAGESLSITSWMNATRIYTLALARMVSSPDYLRG